MIEFANLMNIFSNSIDSFIKLLSSKDIIILFNLLSAFTGGFSAGGLSKLIVVIFSIFL